MTEPALCDLTVHELARRLRACAVAPVDILASVRERIQTREGGVNAFISLFLDQAEEQARALPKPGPGDSPLFGIPVAVKDNMCFQGARTTCGSGILANFVAPYDAFVVGRLRKAQALIIGKTHMAVFAMGASGETSCFGPTRNPSDEARVPGGSSSGSAAAVAYGGAVAALGSDTGGSVRQPAGFCGVVGLKPTYGRVSRYGLVAFASSLDQIGPITRDVTDAAIMLQVIAGRDERDSTSVDRPVDDYAAGLASPIADIRIGLPRETLAAGFDPGMETAFRGALKLLEPHTAGIVDTGLPSLAQAVATYYLICMAEASSNLSRYDGVRYGLRVPTESLEEQYEQTRDQGFRDEVKRRILLGTYGLSKGYYDEYYGTGQRVRTLVRQEFGRAFEQCDVIVTPVSPTTAYKLGEKLSDPLAMYLDDTYTVPASLAGLPAIVVPLRERIRGLPGGLQIIGRPFEEKTILKVAHAFERL
jgi:aspartyl-tRNA(Asn)/glutamyl-tRNA(Gln) amidotransferase subunit A